MVPVLDRYRPVALAATAVFVAVAVLPGATVAGPASFGSTSSFQEVASEEPAADDESDSVALAAPPANGSTPSADATPVPLPPSFSPPSGGPDLGSTAPTSSVDDAPPMPSFSADSGGPTGDTQSADEPLQIVVSAFASTTAGTPIPDDVKDGSLPVGTRIGQVDKASYIRLSGRGSTLVLTEFADGRRGGEFETSPVQACQITESGWEPSEDMGFADAPEHDPDSCTDLLQQPDGTWQLDLAMFVDPADDRGLALVPAEDPPLDFQISFSAQVRA